MLPNLNTSTQPQGAASHADAPSAPAKRRKGRFSRLSPSAIAGDTFGAAPSTVRQRDHVAYLQINLAIDGALGTEEGAAEVMKFAHAFDEQSRGLAVGAVSKITFSDGRAEVLLQLNGDVDPENYGAVVKDAFDGLRSFFASSSILRSHRANRRATWTAKIDGSTIAEDQF